MGSSSFVSATHLPRLRARDSEVISVYGLGQVFGHPFVITVTCCPLWSKRWKAIDRMHILP